MSSTPNRTDAARPQEEFTRLAHEAAAGLRRDPELYRAVTQQLIARLQATADDLVRQGHSPEESVRLVGNQFGFLQAVAAEILAINQSRIRRRAICRLLIGVLLIPLALLLAFYVSYGRNARARAINYHYLQELRATNTDIDLPPSTEIRFPTLPFFREPVYPHGSGNAFIALRGTTENTPAMLRYWQAHQREANSYILYAYYASFLPVTDERSYVAAMRRGEQLEPRNALYNLLLAQYYLQRGMTAQSEQTKDPRIDELCDRRAFELGIAELLRAVHKPYLRTYRAEVARQRLNALPTPRLADDCILRLPLSSVDLFPRLQYRLLARKIPGSARLLLAEGRRDEAEAVMDSWRPFIMLAVRENDDNLIQILLARNIGNILCYEARKTYAQLGMAKKARQADACMRALEQSNRRFHSGSTNGDRLIHRHGAILVTIQQPEFTEALPGPTLAELTPSRMVEHVQVEESVVYMLLGALALLMLGAVAQGVIWRRRLRKPGEVPMMILPPVRVLARAVLFGVVLPIVVYAVYSRLPVIGGRQYGWVYMWPRFTVELLVLSGIILWLPAHLLRIYLRRRCGELSVPRPERREEVRVIRQVFIGDGVALLLALLTGVDALPPFMRIASGLLAIALLILMWLRAQRKRNAHGVYYGTLARSLAPVYACVILFLVLMVQPCQLMQEMAWLRRDTLVYGYLGTRTVISPVEARVAKHLSATVLQIIEGDTQTTPYR